ncbi:cell division protein SepF [Schwartzia sp. (in: firmicutes)]|nr:cell division protein SepF [Schwartzia sp. (in: firmicutes)]
MGIIDKVCGKIGLVDPEHEEIKDTENTEELDEQEKAYFEPMKPQAQHTDNVVSLQDAAAGIGRASRMKVIVIEPRSFDDVQQVANALKEKRPVLINFEKTDADDAKRIIDFISGTTYAISGDIKKVGKNVFLCAPSNVNVDYSQDRSNPMDMSWIKK